jgi:uncharacterized lipoprotein YbaY
MKLIALPLLAVVLLAGCSAERSTPAAPASTVTGNGRNALNLVGCAGPV